MFIHLLVGSLVFFIFGKTSHLEITKTLLLVGAFWGILPDLVSYILSWTLKFDKWAHAHRDNFSHSLFVPITVLALAILLGSKTVIAVSIAMFTHPLLDLLGIGWGVKLFYPLSKKTYKMFYKGQILIIWNQKEVEAEAEKHGDDNWIKNTYFKPNIFGVLEWLSLTGFLILVVIH